MAFLTRGFIPTPWRLDRAKNRPAFIWNIHPSGPKTSTNCFRAFFLSKRITQTWRRGALPHAGFTSMQCIFPSCCRGRTTDAGSIISPSPKDTRPLWEPAGLHPLHSSHLNAFTAPGADCDGSFPRKSARNSRPAPLGALRPFLI